jgi:hypothetical protein
VLLVLHVRVFLFGSNDVTDRRQHRPALIAEARYRFPGQVYSYSVSLDDTVYGMLLLDNAHVLDPGFDAWRMILAKIAAPRTRCSADCARRLR